MGQEQKGREGTGGKLRHGDAPDKLRPGMTAENVVGIIL